MGTLAGVEHPPRYELEISYPGWEVVVEHDPYSFLPTVGELDLHLAAEGRHEELHRTLGAHPHDSRGCCRSRVRSLGAERALRQPRRRLQRLGRPAQSDAQPRCLRGLGAFHPGWAEGSVYKFEIRTQDGSLHLKADPSCGAHRGAPAHGIGRLPNATHLGRRRLDGAAPSRAQPWAEPMSIYEVHLGSWRRIPRDGQPPAQLPRARATQLADYVVEMGFTHVELLPVMEHPFGGSWGYQVTGFFAPTARYGTPDDLRVLVDRLHARGIGVILDWVPAHFPRDDFALARFDGTALYEHADPRRGSHPDWGTLIFNYGRTEVRNFLLVERALLARGVPRRRPARRRRRLDALPRLLARGRGVAAERARRPREPRGGRLSARAERGRPPRAFPASS